MYLVSDLGLLVICFISADGLVRCQNSADGLIRHQNPVPDVACYVSTNNTQQLTTNNFITVIIH